VDARRYGVPCRPADITSAAEIPRSRLRTIKAIDACAKPHSGGDDVTRDDPDRDEYAGWGPPQESGNTGDRSESVDEGSSPDEGPSDTTDLRPPTELRDPLPRDRIRDRFDVTPRQWFVIETLLLISPYPVFVLVYLTIDVNETAFLVVTLLYSLVATYVGILS